MTTNNKSFNGGNNMLSEILSRNFSEEFVTHMKNAMMMSFFKHQDKRVMEISTIMLVRYLLLC